MKTKNIFRMLLVAAALLMGANYVKAGETIFLNEPNGIGDGSSNVDFDIPKGAFDNAQEGDIIHIEYGLQPKQGWTPTYKLFVKDRYVETAVYETTLTGGNSVDVVLTDEMIASFKAIKNNYEPDISARVAGEWIILYKVSLITGSTAYSVSIDENISNGTVTASPTTSLEGSPITLTITPASEDYVLSSLIVDNVNVTSSVTDGTYTFNMPNHNVTVTATFAAVDYSVTTSRTIWSDEDGYAIGNNSDFIFRNAYFNYLVAGDVIRIYGSTTGSNPYASINYSDNGSYSSAVLLNSYLWNGFTEVVLTDDIIENLKSGNYFTISGSGWTITSIQLIKQGSLDYSFVSPLDLLDFGDDGQNIGWNDANAKFSSIPFRGASEGNIIRIWGAPTGSQAQIYATYYINNSEQTIQSFQFADGTQEGSYIDIVLTDTQINNIKYSDYVMIAGTKYHVTKVQLVSLGESYAIRTDADHGIISVKSRAYEGDIVTFTVTPATGYEVNTVRVNDNLCTPDANGVYSFTMGASEAEIVATFTAIDYRLTIEVNNVAYGSVTADATYNYGEEVTLTVHEEPGYELRSINVSAKDENGQYTIPVTINADHVFTMPASDVKVVAEFGAIGYAITYETDGHGMVTGVLKASADEPVELSFTPEIGYEVDAVSYTFGGETTAITANEDGVYSFVMPQGPVTVNVTFKPIYYEISISEVTGGTVAASPETQVYNGTVTLTITPQTNYIVGEVTVTDENGTTVEVSEDNTFTMPASNVTVSVTFIRVAASIDVEVSSYGYSTFCSDYDIDFSNTPEGVKAYIATSIADGYVYLTQLTQKAEAGTPVLLIVDGGVSTRNFTFTEALSGAVSISDNYLKRGPGGNITGNNKYVLTVKNNVVVFAQVGALNAPVRDDQAYLEIPAASARLHSVGISIANDATGIYSIESDERSLDGAVYNLRGQRVEHPGKGLYIVGGKKVVIK